MLELPSGARAQLRPLLGADEDWLASCDPLTPTAVVVTQLLGRCTVRLGDAELHDVAPVRDLLVADRDYLLLSLRALTFGSRFDAVLQCPHCAAKIDVRFEAAEVPVTARPAGGGRQEIDVTDARGNHLRLGFHLPSGADQELAAQTGSEPGLAMLAACVEDVNGVPAGIDIVMEMDEGALAQLEEVMEATAPGVDLAMDLTCPECERAFPADHPLAPFLLMDMRLSSDQLLSEVHALAYHYHWSEADILGLTRPRRRAYLELISSELHRQVEA